MKTMTCAQLGGPNSCEEKFKADSLEKMAELSQLHGMEMAQKQDAAHLEAMNKMRELMSDPKAMQEWFEGVKKEFESQPEEKQ